MNMEISRFISYLFENIDNAQIINIVYITTGKPAINLRLCIESQKRRLVAAFWSD